MDIKSPVTGSLNTSLIRELEVAKIVSLYRDEQQLDVSKYFRDLNVIQLRICNDTGYRFYYPMDIYGDDAFYQHLQKTGLYYLQEKWEYDKAISLIGEGKRVLEIGSGAGFFMQKLKAGRHKQLIGLELNTQQVEMAKINGLDVINEYIEDFSAKNAGSFDVVVALQVLEHVPEVRSFIDASLVALKPGGKLLFCVPYNNPYLYRYDLWHTLNLPPHHSGLWDKPAFRKLPDFFPMRLEQIYIEPLSDYKKYYQIQLSHLKEQGNPLHRLLSLVPAPIYKNALRGMRHMMEGRNILVEFIKK
ncbi:MAG TPA: methyltransferase domain-containing protein [Puia sp.]|jgi:2-polyprenyl-3-methyl-5-hydroxy-6-metoxy-1,4-benzoquinol methylase|nr:methyltransferase domain-containing protein [Puia sp.]